jgi:ankyrin repeat protein
MDHQFNPNNIHLDDPQTPYYSSPLAIDRSTGFNQLQKLILYNHISNQYDPIQKLINSNPELINKLNTRGWSSLMIACINSRKFKLNNIIKLLLSQPNINVNARLPNGWSSLMLACRNISTLSNIETVRLLLKCPDIDVNLQDINGNTPLMIATEYSNNDSSIETINLLLSHPDCNVNLKRNDGYTTLMLAVIVNNVEAVRLILKRDDCDVSLQHNAGSTALILAISRDIRIIELLLDRKYNAVNVVDKAFKTALDYAIELENLGIIELLCRYGAGLEYTNYTVNRLLHNGKREIVELLGRFDVPVKGVMV